MAQPGRDDADVIGRLLIRVYESHERVIARGGGGLEGIRDAALLEATPLAEYRDTDVVQFSDAPQHSRLLFD